MLTDGAAGGHRKGRIGQAADGNDERQQAQGSEGYRVLCAGQPEGDVRIQSAGRYDRGGRQNMVKRRSQKINTYPYVLYINCRKRQTIVKITITPLNTLRDITQRVFFMENRGRLRTVRNQIQGIRGIYPGSSLSSSSSTKTEGVSGKTYLLSQEIKSSHHSAGLRFYGIRPRQGLSIAIYRKNQDSIFQDFPPRLRERNILSRAVCHKYYIPHKNYLPFYRAYHIINGNQRLKHTDSR